MRVVLPDGTVREGRAVDLSETTLDPEVVVASVRDATSTADAYRIECPDPGPGHDALARVPTNVGRARLLTAVGRSRGMAAPVDDEIDRLTARLADDAAADDHTEPLRAARRRLADAGDDEARLRERAATLRGRLAAHREAGDDDAIEATRSELVDVTTELSEVETERIAAEQRLDALERAAARSRDHRDERLRLTDALANRRREARAYFADALAAEFDDARDALVEASTEEAATTTEEAATTTEEAATATEEAATATETPVTDACLAGLAAVRLADLRAPVVTTCRFFADAETAARHLDVPVVRM